MPSSYVEFGYLPQPRELTCGNISIAQLDDAPEQITEIRSSPQVLKDWYYAPPSGAHDMLRDRTIAHPYSTRVFTLPKTHRLDHATCDDPDHLDFLVWCLGFFEGLRLTTFEAGYLDATPIKAGKLTDFVLMGGTTSCDAIDLAERFWTDNAASPRRTKRLIGIIHSLFLAQNPNHLPFETFSYLYMALDACFKLTCDLHGTTSRSGHAARVAWTCGQFNMPIPTWAASPRGQGTQISTVRNDTIHEALFFDEPLGFVTYGGHAQSSGQQNVPLQMMALVCRFIVALLGKPDADYVRSAVNTRQRIGLKLV